MFEVDQMVEEGGLTLVGEFDSIQEANDYALVVLAMNLDCWVKMEAGGGRFGIFAEAAFEIAIRQEFELYRQEQSEPVRQVDPPIFESGVGLTTLWVMALVTVFLFQDRDQTLANRFCNSSLAVFDGGEWWRPFTALFLHGDFQHLLGNIAIGGIFCVLVAHSVGPWLGWALILASGMIGNILTAFVHYPEPFSSLGASSATFGALGILVGSSSCLAWWARSYRRLAAAFIPVAAGGILLGWFGAGGPQTDVLAHLAGFSVGACLGFAASWFCLQSKAS